MTAFADDSVGGDTNGDGASDGAGSPVGLLLEVRLGAEVSLTDVQMRRAGTAVRQSGGVLVARGTSFGEDGAPLGIALDLSGGDAAVRGSIRATAAVLSCDWGTEGCGVDASEVDWGSPNGALGLVCGQVFTNPYLHNRQTVNAISWSTNCSGTTSPAQRLSTSQQNFNDAVGEARAHCQVSGDGVCAVIETSMACLSGAASAAGADAPFPYAVPDGSDFATDFGEHTISMAGEHLSRSHNPDARSVGRLLGVLGIFDTAVTLVRLAAAYDQCAP
jgi:hypothetical protein